MKKKIANIVEIILELVALILFFIMRGVAVTTDGVRFEASFIGALNQIIIYAVIFYILWATNLIACVASIISNKKTRDNAIHSILPIILLVVTDFMAMSLFKELPATFTIANLVMLIMIIVSFVKRSQSIVDEVKKVVVVNDTQSNADELKKYKDLLDNGTITQEEFDQKKKQLLGL